MDRHGPENTVSRIIQCNNCGVENKIFLNPGSRSIVGGQKTHRCKNCDNILDNI